VARSVRLLVALGAIIALVGVLSACGDSVPGDSVARVGDTSIKKKTFDHWLTVAALSSQPPGSTGKPVVPDPPNFTRCVAAKRAAAAKPVKGQPKPTDTQLKAQCKQEYEGARDQVMQFLIQGEWIQGEAKDLGVKAKDSDVQKSFQQQKKQSFPTEKQYQDFLKSSGMTQQDILLRVKLDLLSNKIRAKVTKGKDKVTQQDIQAYYNKNKQRFAQPERRDLDVVLTKTRAKATRALKALRSGQSFKAVAKKYSIDQASKSQGGKLPDVTPGQQEKAFDAAIFKARKGKLVGPVKTQFGYYVFKVTTIKPPSQQTLQQASPTIKQLLASQGQQKALNSFVKDFQKKWKGQTNCRKGFVIQLCKNAPKPKTNTSTTPPGAVPQGGQGGAPQGGQGGAPQGGAPQGGGTPQQVPQQSPGQ
jgi:foldase protein PrsA